VETWLDSWGSSDAGGEVGGLDGRDAAGAGGVLDDNGEATGDAVAGGAVLGGGGLDGAVSSAGDWFDDDAPDADGTASSGENDVEVEEDDAGDVVDEENARDGDGPASVGESVVVDVEEDDDADGGGEDKVDGTEADVEGLTGKTNLTASRIVWKMRACTHGVGSSARDTFCVLTCTYKTKHWIRYRTTTTTHPTTNTHHHHHTPPIEPVGLAKKLLRMPLALPKQLLRMPLALPAEGG
jgi:hypothetical protein